MPEYLKHPLIKENTLQAREYQQSILLSALNKNTLCVLPTGLGKTNLAILLAAHRLQQFPDSKVLLLAPTRPLVNQHYESFSRFLKLPLNEFQVITGTINPSKRRTLYEEKHIILATPQTVQNDLKTRRITLKDFSLLVLDEIHHAIGRYAYPAVAQAYLKQSAHPRILGLTASPGGTTQKIKEVCKNCGIEAVEIRTEKDQDVAPYVHEKKIKWIDVDLPPSFLELRQLISTAYKKRIDALKRQGFIRGSRVTKKQLLELQSKLFQAIGKGYRKAFSGIRYTTQAIKLEHALGLLETQGISALEKYWTKLRSDKKAIQLLRDPYITQAIERSRTLALAGCRHPKISALCSITEQTLSENPDAKMIVFANYRDTVSDIVSVLSGIKGARPVEFIGQRGGLTQTEQVQRIKDFRSQIYNILVGTSISEEGLDIPSVDVAVFYEPVPSAIRSIQRRGRVGRQRFGKVIILITRNTRDEAYYWAAKQKEKRMHSTLRMLATKKEQTKLENYKN